MRQFLARVAAEPRPWLRRIKRKLGRRVRRRADAEDVLQDAIVHALESMGRCRATTRKELLAWFVGHVRNARWSAWRNVQAGKRRLSLEAAAEELETVVAPGLSPLEIAAALETAGRVLEALSALRRLEATLFRRVRLEGLRVGEAARDLRIAPREASRALYRAKLLLRRHLGAT